MITRRSLLRTAKRLAPNTPLLNRILAAQDFRRVHGRLPVSIDHPDALINDFIFDRMIAHGWTAHQIRCVDKISAKDEAAKLCPSLLIAKTVSVIPMRHVRSPEALIEQLRPYIGRDLVAKPAHGSGGVVMLRTATDQQIRDAFFIARENYFFQMREVQYYGLPARILVEEKIRTPEGCGLVDFKFHCVGGIPILCQVMMRSRKVEWNKLLSLPDFGNFDLGDGIAFPATWRMPSEKTLAEMLQIASALASPFDYVRIDLYSGIGGVYFGEFTFTPGASVSRAPFQGDASAAAASHRRYSEHVLSRLRKT